MFSSINPHGIIAAATGAGKSFFTNDMIMQYRRLKSLTFIIDVGRSYRKLCMMYGGEFVDFDSEDPILVNPFLGGFDEDKQDSLTEFLMSIITFNPRNRLDGIDEATIERAIVHTYERAKAREVILEDVLESLRSHGDGERGPYIAELLFKYSKKGRFGRYINGRNNLNTEKDLIVFNLDRIKNKELQAVYLMVIIQYIREVFEKTPPGVIKQLFIDEAWGLLENEESAKFLETGYRTYRKLNAGITCITQNPEVDLLQKPSGRAIISSAENVFLLKQKPEVITMIAKPFQFSDLDIRNLKEIDTVPGYYADIMNICGGNKKIFRLYPSRLTTIVSTSKSEHNAVIYGKMEKEGKDFSAVLEELLADPSHSFT